MSDAQKRQHLSETIADVLVGLLGTKAAWTIMYELPGEGRRFIISSMDMPDMVDMLLDQAKACVDDRIENTQVKAMPVPQKPS